MADILIRGMEMPDGCHHCRFSYLDKGETNDGEPCSVIMCSAMEQGTNGAEYDGNRPSWCHLVPLPEGHGRLIDADELIKAKSVNNIAIMIDIADAPTIIPAEGGGEDGA